MAIEPDGSHSSRPVRAISAGRRMEYSVRLRFVRFFTKILGPLIPHSYIVASVISSLLNISVAYFGYKFFVFKTKGNYLREWVRCVGVYSGGIIFGVITLPILVALIRRNTRFVAQAPYIAGALLTAFMVVYSFVGHKKFSFRSPA